MISDEFRKSYLQVQRTDYEERRREADLTKDEGGSSFFSKKRSATCIVNHTFIT